MLLQEIDVAEASDLLNLILVHRASEESVNDFAESLKEIALPQKDREYTESMKMAQVFGGEKEVKKVRLGMMVKKAQEILDGGRT